MKRAGLVLSLFPGIGLLDMAFEEEGFCVVRGPDKLWGGDVKLFHPPAGRFDGVIGGSPCQRFTRLAALIQHNGYELAENLVPEFERVVAEAQPEWFLHENVRGAPIPSVPGYQVDPRIVNGRWLGEEQSREHRMSFGVRGRSRCIALDISPSCHVLENARWAPRVLASGGTSGCLGPRAHNKKKRTDLHNRLRNRRYFEEAKRLQGLPTTFDLPPFKVEQKIRALGNAVPLPLGRAIARAVKAAIGALVLLGPVACSSPTAPDYAGVPLVFEGVAVSPDQQAAALAEWDFQAACTGFNRKVTGALPVEAHQGFFACVGQAGSVAVNGCTTLASDWGMGRIQVNAFTYVPGVSHELIHWMKKLPDPQHTDPVWDRCDHLHDRRR